MKYFLATYTIARAGYHRDGYKLIYTEYHHQAEMIIRKWLKDNSLENDFTSCEVEQTLE